MDLTIFGTIIAVVGLTLQFTDAFAQHPEMKKAIVFLSFGMFLGIAASAALGARYHITGNVDRSYLLLFSIVGCALFCAVLAYITNDENRRAVAGIAALCFGAAFLLTGIAYGFAGRDPTPSYSFEEVAALAERAERIGDYETALQRLRELEDRVETDQARDAISQRVASVQSKQIGGNQQ